MKKQETKTLIGLCAMAAVLSITNITTSLMGSIAQSYSDVPYETLALLMTLPTLIGMVVAFISGPIIMKVDPKVLLVIVACCVLTDLGIFALVGENGPLVLLYIAVCFAGISTGSNMILLSSLVHQCFDPSRHGSLIAMLTAMIQGGSAIANMVAGNIAAKSSWPNAYWIGLIVIPVAILFVILVPGKSARTANLQQHSHPSQKGESQAKERLPRKAYLIIAIKIVYCFCLGAFSFNYSNYIINEYQLGSSAQAGTIGFLYMLTGMLTGFTYSFWNKLLKKTLVPLAHIMLPLAILSMLVFHDSLLGVTVAAILVGFSSNVTSSGLMAKMMQVTPSKLVPIGTSLLQGSVTCSAFISLYVLRFVGSAFGGGMNGSFIAAILFGAIAWVMSMIVCRESTAETQNA